MAKKKAKKKLSKKVAQKKIKAVKGFAGLDNVHVDTNVSEEFYGKLVKTSNNGDVTLPLTKKEFAEIEKIIEIGDANLFAAHPKTLRTGFVTRQF